MAEVIQTKISDAPFVNEVRLNARHWAAVNDESGYYLPADLTAWSAAFMGHL